MDSLPKKPRKKKMADISSRPVSVRVVKSEKPEPIKTEKPEPAKKIREEFNNLDQKIEKFEKEEKEQFKEEEKIKEKKAKRMRIRMPRLKAWIFLGAVIAIGGGGCAAAAFLPRVDIKFVTRKTEWNFIDSVFAAKNASLINSLQKQLPAEVFSVTKDFNFSYQATGKKDVQRKATGKITIYNAYSSDAQVLSATTRFAAPDGKFFRLVQKITVPGAKIADGKIVPSSIDADVAADKAGPDYNIGPVSRFSIPGFEGTAKYRGFYAESQNPMTGGFVGEVAYPTDSDIKAAKQKSNEQLRNSEETFLAGQISQDFKIIDGAEQFSVLKQEVNVQTDDKNNFTVFTQAALSKIAFRESDLKSLMENLAQADSGKNNFKIKTCEIDYGAGRADFKQGQVSFAVDFKGVFEEPVDAEVIRKSAANKNENDLRALALSLPGIEKITLSFWPFWVKRAPDNINRIKVEVE